MPEVNTSQPSRKRPSSCSPPPGPLNVVFQNSSSQSMWTNIERTGLARSVPTNVTNTIGHFTSFPNYPRSKLCRKLNSTLLNRVSFDLIYRHTLARFLSQTQKLEPQKEGTRSNLSFRLFESGWLRISRTRVQNWNFGFPHILSGESL